MTIFELGLSAMFGGRPAYAFALLLLLWAGLGVSMVDAADIMVEGDCALADAIDAANRDRAVGGCEAGSGADMIALTSDVLLLAELPEIRSPITIMGGGFVISGEGFFRIFFVGQEGDLTIDSLTLRDGATHADARTCIDWEPRQWTAGGAICNLGALSVSASRFSGNGAEFGGAIASVGAVTIVGSEFSGNGAYSGGAVFNWSDGTVTIEGSEFSDNAARADLVMAQEFLDKHEDDDTEFGTTPIVYNGNGGAISSSLGGVITVTDTSFQSNTADLGGGAIVDHGTAEINDSQFSKNLSDYGGGGAIKSCTGALTLKGSVFRGNSAVLGGAVVSWGMFEIVASHFSENSAVRGGAIHINDHTDLSISGGVFSDNSASDSGGAIFIFGKGMLAVADSQFSDNSANIRGGAIFSYGMSSVTASRFRSNRAGDLGGAFMNGGVLTISGSEFSQNSASEGGGIYNEWDFEGVVELEGNTYSGNRGGDCSGCG